MARGGADTVAGGADGVAPGGTDSDEDSADGFAVNDAAVAPGIEAFFGAVFLFSHELETVAGPPDAGVTLPANCVSPK